MDFDVTIETLRRQIEAEIQSLFVDRNPPGLYRPMTYLLESGGKRIRPLFVVLSCQAVGGDIRKSLPVAAALELFHTFTLIHDDIMDHDETRRGKPTVHNRWDESTAILAGDGLLILAYQSLLNTRHPEILTVMKTITEGLMVLHEGQALDKDFENRDDVTLQEYREMIEKKTAKLLEVACIAGGIVGNGTKEEILSLGQFAKALGTAFQIQDDMLDIFSETLITGKPIGSDIVEKKKTYLTIHFLNHAGENNQKQFLKYWGNPTVRTDGMEQVRQLFREAGTFSAAQNEIETLMSDAVNHLNTLRNNEAREALKHLSLKIKNRIS
jgi:geranylgeranyl pyrophosphate synthase